MISINYVLGFLRFIAFLFYMDFLGEFLGLNSPPVLRFRGSGSKHKSLIGIVYFVELVEKIIHVKNQFDRNHLLHKHIGLVQEKNERLEFDGTSFVMILIHVMFVFWN